MFSGIVEEYAEVVRIVKEQENLHLTLKCSFVDELKIDQSISHNGVCLTVVSLQDGTYTVTAMKETIERSNIGLLKVGDKVNVERSMMMNGRLDGHIVQGHVDQTAVSRYQPDERGYAAEQTGHSRNGSLQNRQKAIQQFLGGAGKCP
jgi:riboflavin synthase